MCGRAASIDGATCNTLLVAMAVARSSRLASRPAMDWVDGSAGPLRVETTGTGAGTPVLLVHGGGADRSHWHALIPLLATDRTVVSFDQRGYGESPSPTDGRRDLAAMAEDVLAIASATGLDRPILVGHSFGGAVTGEAVARFP